MRFNNGKALLLGLNLALLAGVGWRFSRSTGNRPQPEASLPEEGAPDPAPLNESVQTSQRSATPQPKDPKFSWKSVSSRDLKQHIQKLRMVECPEETIQDIILAEVDRIYQAKEAAIGLKRDIANPWEGPGVDRIAEFDRSARLRQLRVEKRDLIFELLGIDVPGDIPSLVGSTFNTAWEQALALLPLEKRGPVRAIQDRFWEQTETLRKRLDNLLLPEDADEYRRLRIERTESLKKILSPKELEDVEMRTSTTGNSLRTQLSAFEPSESEFREIFRIKRDLHESSYVPGQLVGEESSKRAEAVSLAASKAEERLRETLGESRFAEYQRSQDSEFQQVSRIARDAGLSRDVAITAYEAQKGAQERIQREMQNPELTSQQRRAVREQIQAEVTERMKNQLGEAGFQQLQQLVPRFRNSTSPRPGTVPSTATPVLPGNFQPAIPVP